jgi:hypothetical protein
MYRHPVAALGLLLQCASCWAPRGAAQPAAPVAAQALGKPAAPVEMAVDFGPQGATLRLVFTAAASDVAVEVRGIRGLQLATQGAVLHQGTVHAGDHRAWILAFAEPTPAGALVVTVRAKVLDALQTKVQMFAVPTAAAAAGSMRGRHLNSIVPSLHLLPSVREP